MADDLEDDVLEGKKSKKAPKMPKGYDPEMAKVPWYNGHDYAYVNTMDEWVEMMSRIYAEGVKGPDGKVICGIDLETWGDDPLKDKIHGFSVSWAKGVAKYVMWDVVEQHRQVCAEDLMEIKLVTQNGKFDYHFTREWLPEFTPDIEADTMLMLHLLNPNEKHGLKQQAWKKLGYHMMTLFECLGVKEADLKSGKAPVDFTPVPLDRLLQYGCSDSDITLQLYWFLKDKTRPQFSNPEQIDIALNVPVLLDMERIGMAINKRYLEAIEPLFERAMVRLQKNIYEIVGHDFDIESPQQVGKVLFGDKKKPGDVGLGLTPLKYTKKTKAPSTTADDLEKLAKIADNDVLNWIVEYKHHSHSLSAYVRALLNGVCEKTGAIHAEYMTAVAPTYRLACVGGSIGGGSLNVQGVPKTPEILIVELADEEVTVLTDAGVELSKRTDGLYDVAYLARKPFVARKGKYYCSADYQAIEFRIIINESGEAEVGKSIRAGEDGHKRVASLLYRKPQEDITKAERDACKTLNYGLAYGMQPFTLKDRMGIDESLAIALFDRYFAAMPMLAAWIKDIQRFGRKNGYVSTCDGRSRDVRQEYEMNMNRGDRSSVNTTIQGSAAAIMRMALVRAHITLRKKYGHLVEMIATLHDQIIFEVDDSISKDEFAKDVRRVMEMDNPAWSCPLPVDISFGPGWGDLVDYGKTKAAEKAKKQRVVLVAGDKVPNDLWAEIKLLVASLPEGESPLFLRAMGEEGELRKVKIDKSALTRMEEGLGGYFKVRIEDMPDANPAELISA